MKLQFHSSLRHLVVAFTVSLQTKTNSVALSPRATCRRNLMSTFVDRGVSRGQRGGSPTVVNLTSKLQKRPLVRDGARY
jgi:hypothetical protein